MAGVVKTAVVAAAPDDLGVATILLDVTASVVAKDHDSAGGRAHGHLLNGRKRRLNVCMVRLVQHAKMGVLQGPVFRWRGGLVSGVCRGRGPGSRKFAEAEPAGLGSGGHGCKVSGRGARRRRCLNGGRMRVVGVMFVIIIIVGNQFCFVLGAKGRSSRVSRRLWVCDSSRRGGRACRMIRSSIGAGIGFTTVFFPWLVWTIRVRLPAVVEHQVTILGTEQAEIGPHRKAMCTTITITITVFANAPAVGEKLLGIEHRDDGSVGKGCRSCRSLIDADDHDLAIEIVKERQVLPVRQQDAWPLYVAMGGSQRHAVGPVPQEACGGGRREIGALPLAAGAWFEERRRSLPRVRGRVRGEGISIPGTGTVWFMNGPFEPTSPSLAFQ
mmetsp:Transcript_399/g.1018  ORF Transcript_399/g.1018 Transcript_399/m.1018 type:complete len:384 (-) Transcript_399:538-1689(-)